MKRFSDIGRGKEFNYLEKKIIFDLVYSFDKSSGLAVDDNGHHVTEQSEHH